VCVRASECVYELYLWVEKMGFLSLMYVQKRAAKKEALDVH